MADLSSSSVGDKKYLREGEDHRTLAHNLLVSLGASPALAQKVQIICLGVSYSSEIQDLNYVKNLIAQYLTAKTEYAYICGPDEFVADMKRYLLELGLKEEQIVIEQ